MHLILGATPSVFVQPQGMQIGNMLKSLQEYQVKDTTFTKYVPFIKLHFVHWYIPMNDMMMYIKGAQTFRGGGTTTNKI